MRSRSPQLIKEARQLAWPWMAVMAPGLVLLASPWLSASPQMTVGTWHRFTDWVLGAGTFFGSLLLAALPLGAEFQYRTLAMRLAQPVERRALWRQKFLLSIAAVMPPAVIYCVAIGVRYGRPSAIVTAAWITVILAGGIPFTLLTRSTIGGVVLNTTGGFGVTLAWMYYEKHGQFPPVWLWAIGIGLAGYAAVMIWLGRRMLLRFQAADGMQAGETFVPGARLVPRAVAGWFRCRPTEPLRNLVRREFRLMRALWPLSLLHVAAWICLVLFRQLPTDRPESQLAAFGFTVIFGVLIAILAGTLSLGEEKTWGTHEWHMTLPVSASLQWVVKLLFAVFTSLVCTALLPMGVLILGGWLGRPTARLLDGNMVSWMTGAVAITLIAFWSACVVKGTVQATIWMFPLSLAVAFAGESGPWALKLVVHPFHNLVAGIVSRLDAIALERAMFRIVPVFLGRQNVVALAVAPLLAVGLIQSHRLFRAQVGAHRLRVVRCALPLIIVAFVCSLAGDVFMGVLVESLRQRSTILRETDSAIAAVQADSRTDTWRPRRLSLDDLAHAAPLSDGTQRWLRKASITVAPAPEPVGNGPAGRILLVVPGARSRDRVPYSAVVRAANGTECSMTFQVQKQGPAGFVTAICQ